MLLLVTFYSMSTASVVGSIMAEHRLQVGVFFRGGREGGRGGLCVCGVRVCDLGGEGVSNTPTQWLDVPALHLTTGCRCAVCFFGGGEDGGGGVRRAGGGSWHSIMSVC